MEGGAPDDALIALLDALDIDDHINYPKRVLESLLNILQHRESKYHARYGPFVEEGQSRLVQQLSQCLSPRVHELFNKSCGVIQKSQISSLGGNIASHGPAIYLHLVQTSNEDWYWYIGQAYNLYNRVNLQHRDFRHRRDHPSLHYYVHDRSIKDRFVVLANLDDCSIPVSSSNLRLVLNLLEMWCCLLFRCLPSQTLSTWLSDEDFFDISFDGPIRALNVALPLDMGDELASVKAFQLLKQSDDDLIQQYYAAVRSGDLRPRATPRKQQNRASVAVTNKHKPEDRSDFAVGLVMGAFGTLAAFWIRRLLLGSLSRVGQSKS